MFCSAIAHPSASRLQACTSEPYFQFILELQITWMCKSILSSWPILAPKTLLIAYPLLSYDLIGVRFFFKIHNPFAIRFPAANSQLYIQHFHHMFKINSRPFPPFQRTDHSNLTNKNVGKDLLNIKRHRGEKTAFTKILPFLLSSSASSLQLSMVGSWSQRAVLSTESEFTLYQPFSFPHVHT